MRKFLSLLFVTLNLGIFVQPAFADNTPTSLSISPAIIERVLTPSKEDTFTLTLTNNSTIPLPIRGNSSNLNQDLRTTGSRYNSASWISLDPPDFILQPGDKQTITLHILPPVDAQPGGHYSTVTFSPLIPAGLTTTPEALAQVGAVVLMTIPGDITESLELKDASFPRLITSLPRDFNLSLKNSGNIHLSPNFHLTLLDHRGELVTTIPVQTSLILPDTTKTFLIRWPSATKWGHYTITGTINYGTNNSLTLPLFSIWFIPIFQLIFFVTLTLISFWLILKYRRVVLALKVLFGRAI